MLTRCNRGLYCRSYCLLNMFRAPLFPSSGAQEYYTVVAACGISCCGFQVAGLVWSWGLCVRFAGCCSIFYTVYSIYLLQWTEIMPLHNMHVQTFLIEAHCVHYDVRIQSLLIQWKLTLVLEGSNSDHTTQKCLTMCHIRFIVECFTDLQSVIINRFVYTGPRADRLQNFYFPDMTNSI